MESGGYATTKGMRFQYLWIARQLLFLLSENLHSVRIEPAGSEGEGVDVIITTSDGKLEFHQCKRSNRQTGKWTLNDLTGRRVLQAIGDRLRANREATFKLVSRDAAPQLRDLAESARDSRDPGSFYQDQICSSVEREKAFEAFCRALDLDSSRPEDLEEARDLLQRSDAVLTRDDDTVLRELKTLSFPYVDGDPPQVISALESWGQQALRRDISIGSVEAFLRSSGFHPRVLARDPRLLPTINQLKEAFLSSLETQLVSGRLLARQEADALVEVLNDEDGPRFIAVHGPAGVGKSGVLFDLAQRLQSQGVLYLPLRLDRQRPEGTTRKFGEALELPGSPATCLDQVSATGTAVLLLDQLDALRWTGADAGQALDTCRQMVDEALASKNLRVVASCRTYDLESDPRIRNWIEVGQARKIPVSRLSEAVVRQVVAETGVDPASLTGRQLDLLRTIQLLRAWEQTVGTSQRGIEFASERELLDAFWESRVEEAAQKGVDPETLQQAVAKVVTYLDENAVLTAPSRLFHGRPKVKKILLSLNVLTEDANGIQFCHQTYLDHHLAHLLMQRIDEGATDVQGWLTNTHQDLRRREQLRLILGLLRDERPDRYSSTVDALIDSPAIRFHLKQLILQFLGNVESPSSCEADLVMSLLKDPAWKEHVIAEVLQGRAPWLRAAVEGNVIQNWLDGTDEERAQAFGLIRSISDKEGDLCHQLLTPLVDRGEEWLEQVASAFPIAPSKDSDSLFDLRLRLAGEGVRWSHLDWTGLGGEHLPRLVQLLPIALPRTSIGRPEVRSDAGFLYGIEKLEVEGRSFGELIEAWDSVIPAASRAMGFAREPKPLLLWDHEHGWRVRLRQFLQNLARELMSLDPLGFMGRANEESCHLSKLLTVSALSKIDQPGTADCALRWLMENPSALRERWREDDLPWEVSRPVVEHLTEICSDATFALFQDFLLRFQEPSFRRDMEYRHESLLSPPEEQPRFSTWALQHPSPAGQTGYHLLPCLPADRMSRAASLQLVALQRKFARVDKIFFGVLRARAGFVGSTISSDRISRLSDKTWLEIIDQNATRRPGGRFHEVFEDGGFKESSPRTFSSDLETVTAREPGRFARLALRFPPETNPLYFQAIVRGLRQQRQKEPPLEDATVEELEAVLDLPQVSNDPSLSRSIAWLIESRSDLNWSTSTLDRLATIANEDPQPASGELVLRGEDEDWGPKNLVNNMLNCARGAATHAIARLIFKDPKRIETLARAVERAARDPHPAVRVAVFDCCLAMLDHQPAHAISLALTAAEEHEALFASSHFREFLGFAARRHPKAMEPTLHHMLRSERDDVVQAGASQSVALFITMGRMEKAARECIRGSESQRRGAARVAAALAGNDDFQEAALDLLSELIHDDSDKVLRACAEALHDTELDAFAEASSFLDSYASSRAFKHYPTLLLHKLHSHAGDLQPFAECILTVCESLAQRREESPDETQTMSWDAGHLLPPTLLRLYEQAPNGSRLRRRCLDAWDRLLEARVLSAMNLTKSLEADTLAGNR